MNAAGIDNAALEKSAYRQGFITHSSADRAGVRRRLH